MHTNHWVRTSYTCYVDHGKAQTRVLGNLEHELWIPWNPIWIRPSRREHVTDISNAWREQGRDSHALDCRPVDGAFGAAHYRVPQRQHVASAVGKASPLLFDRGHSQFGCAVFRALQQRTLDGGRILVDPRCQHQCEHGAVPRTGCGQIAGVAAQLWICVANPHHWHWHVDCVEFALVCDPVGRVQRGGSGGVAAKCLCVFCHWRGRLLGQHFGHRVHHD